MADISKIKLPDGATYDLKDAATYSIASQALSAAMGTLLFDTTYTIANGVATFAAHVFSAGQDVTDDYAAADFAWYYRIGQTASTVSLGTGKTKAVTLSGLGYGGSVGCVFDDGN